MLTFGKIFGIIFFSLNLKDTLANRIKNSLHYLTVQVVYIILNYVGFSILSAMLHINYNIVKKNTYFINLILTMITSTMKPLYFYKKRVEFKTVLLGIDEMNVLTSKTRKYLNYKKRIFIAVVLIITILIMNGTFARNSPDSCGIYSFLYFLCYSIQQHVVWLEFLVLQSISSEYRRHLSSLKDKLNSLSRVSTRKFSKSVLSVAKNAAMSKHFIRTVMNIVDVQRRVEHISSRFLNILIMPLLLVLVIEFFAILANAHYIASTLRLWVMDQSYDVYLGLWAVSVAVMSFAFITVVLQEFARLSIQVDTYQKCTSTYINQHFSRSVHASTDQCGRRYGHRFGGLMFLYSSVTYHPWSRYSC